MKMGKLEFCTKAGYPNLRNNVWSWDATSKDGSVLMLVWQGDSERVDRGVERVWVWGNSPSDMQRGGVERKRHLDLISSGVSGVVAFCTSNDGSHSSIDDINPVLFRVVAIEPPDATGKVHVIAHHPNLRASLTA